jgi:5-methylcytosine-specific restriction endonuclease McrA
MARDAIHGPCPYCHGKITPATFSADHDRPVSRDGSWELWNVIGCCRRCNDVKGALTGEEFMALLALTTPWPSQVRQNLLARLRAGGRIMRKSGSGLAVC